MTRAEFERMAREHNAKRDAAVVAARTTSSPCVVVDMLAFGGIPYCTAHRVMGPCPYSATLAKDGAR